MILTIIRYLNFICNKRRKKKEKKEEKTNLILDN